MLTILKDLQTTHFSYTKIAYPYIALHRQVQFKKRLLPEIRAFIEDKRKMLNLEQAL